MSARFYYLPNSLQNTARPPTRDELETAVEITDYVTDGDRRFRADLRRAAEQMATAMGVTADAFSENLKDLAKALDAHVYKKPQPPQRHMNTNMKYPTSTPPWKRGRK